MNTIEAIKKRKSVRSYTGEKITKEELSVILQAADAAPIGLGKYESVHLTVITKKSLLSKIDAAGAKMFGKPDIHPLYGAPMMIVVSAKAPSDSGMANVTYSNAAGIVQNMALAATELGVGACHIWGATAALAGSEELCGEVGIPEGFVPCCAIVLGKTDYNYPERDVPSGRIELSFVE